MTTGGLGTVPAAHEPIDHRVPHLERGKYAPEPAWTSDLSLTPSAEVSQCDCCHDYVEDQKSYQDRPARLPMSHGVMVVPEVSTRLRQNAVRVYERIVRPVDRAGDAADWVPPDP